MSYDSISIEHKN